MPTRRDSLRTLLGAGAAPAVLRGARRAGDKPNLLFLWTDEQRADTLAVNGNRGYRLPVLNRLAGNSVSFTRCYDTQPVCAPARCSVEPRDENRGRLREDHVFTQWHTEPAGPHARCVVSPDGWKLALFDRDHCLLFDREKDPLEMRNLHYQAEALPARRKLRVRMEAWQRATNDKLALPA